MAYQRIQISTGANVGDPGPLPANVVGLSDGDLANIPAAISPCPEGYEDTGFVPYVPPPYVPPAPPAPTSRLKPVGLFLTSIPFDKFVAMKAAEATDPVIAACLTIINTLTNIDMMDPHTAAMLGLLEQKNYLSADEVTAILAA